MGEIPAPSVAIRRAHRSSSTEPEFREELCRQACAWALNELDEKVTVPFSDPSDDISFKLPHAAWWPVLPALP